MSLIDIYFPKKDDEEEKKKIITPSQRAGAEQKTKKSLVDTYFPQKKEPLVEVEEEKPGIIDRVKEFGKKLTGGKIGEIAKKAFTTAVPPAKLLQEPEGTFERQFRAGVGDIISVSGGTAKWLGFDGLGTTLATQGGKFQEVAVEDTLGEFDWKELYDPAFYSQRVTRALPFSLALLPAAIIGAKAGVAAGVTIGLGLFGRTVLGAIGAATLSRPIEAALEAGGTYDEQIDKGKTPEEANKAANKTFLGNLSLVSLDAAEFLTAFAPIKGGKGFLKAIKRSAAITGSIAMEGSEEVIQEGIQQVAQDEELDLTSRESQMAGAIGGIMGGGLGVAGSLYQKMQTNVVENYPDEVNKLREKNTPESEIVNELTNNHPKDVEKIITNTIKNTSTAPITTETVEKEEEKKEIAPTEKPTEISKTAPTGKITTYSGGGTAFSTPNLEFTKQFGEPVEIAIDAKEVLDTRNVEQRTQLEAKLGKEKVDEMINDSVIGVPSHNIKGTIKGVQPQEALIQAAKELGFKYIALSETDKTTKFDGQDVISYAATGAVAKKPTEVKAKAVPKELEDLAEDAKKYTKVSSFVADSIFAKSLNGVELKALSSFKGKNVSDQLETFFNQVKEVKKPEKKVEPKPTPKKDTTGFKPTTKVVPKKVSVPRSQLPVGEGAERVSRLEARVKGALGRASQEEIEELGLSTFKVLNNAENIAKASEYVANNTEDALRVINGDIEAPKGILRNSIYIALKQLGAENTDVATKVASLASTRAGQEISILRSIEEDNPVTLMEDIVQTRVEAYKKRTGIVASEKVKREIDKIKIKTPSKDAWVDFVESLKC